ncbi:MAG: hypothetical protein ACRDAO_01460 [Culicoidibacterales bacterium]
MKIDLYDYNKKNVELTAVDGKTYTGFAIWIDEDEFEREPESLELDNLLFYAEDIKKIKIID